MKKKKEMKENEKYRKRIRKIKRMTNEEEKMWEGKKTQTNIPWYPLNMF